MLDLARRLASIHLDKPVATEPLNRAHIPHVTMSRIAGLRDTATVQSEDVLVIGKEVYVRACEIRAAA